MKQTTLVPISFEQQTPTTTSDTKTFTVPGATSAILVTVETTNARLTIEGTAPDATHGHVIPKDGAPLLLPVGSGTTIKAVSTASANAVIGITYLG